MSRKATATRATFAVRTESTVSRGMALVAMIDAVREMVRASIAQPNDAPGVADRIASEVHGLAETAVVERLHQLEIARRAGQSRERLVAKVRRAAESEANRRRRERAAKTADAQ